MEQPTARTTPAATRRRDWKRAWRALRNLIDDPDRTDQVFEIVRALSGGSFERAYQRFVATADGRRLLVERPSLLATLSDRAALVALPAGSFGRAYADFMHAGQLDAAGLVEAAETARNSYPIEVQEDEDHRFFGDRLRDMHDLWHVLTGYGRDEAGEAANLAFTLGQVWNPGIAVIVVASALLGPKEVTFYWQRYLFRAWRRGRKARLLTAVPYERLLAKPLEQVRSLLAIEAAQITHPDGILIANRGEDPHVAAAA
jgi:ubiquinone biosynthesis protein COQ4